MKKFGLLGQNIGYSLSPKIHSIIYAHIGIEAEYKLYDFSDKELEKNIDTLFGLDGFNVTKPYKKEIVKYLCNSPEAVNTVYKRVGYNTDIIGFKQQIEEGGFNFKGAKTLIIGAAGGVASVVIPVLQDLGAECFGYDIAVRGGESIGNFFLEKKVSKPSKKTGGATFCEEERQSSLGGEGLGVSGGVVQSKAGKYDAIINCSTYGLNLGENAADGIDFSSVKFVYDLIYFDTPLIKTARGKNIEAENGLKMLIYQAIAADEIFLQTKINDKKILMEKIINECFNN